MAKRNIAKFATRGRKSALRVEALEQRQLLAAITGGGTEVGSNIEHPNGNVYDQVLMTGSSVTVGADPGQVTRVSFLDLSGDIVQAEFSGAGTLSITLDGFVSKAAPANYNQPGVEYVSGNATFTIQGSNADTNFSVFSVGPGNAVNQGLFEGGLSGGNNIADIQALVIVNNPLNPGGFTNFGGIRAGNAVFSGSSGNVGITGLGISVQGPVIIGDIDASDVGVPVLNFGGGSQFNTLIVAGGNLVQSNGQQILGGSAAGIQSVNFTAGATSLVGAGQPGDLGAQVNPTGPGIFSLGNPVFATLDAVTAIDITGKTQAQINDLFTGRTFINDITITGELSGLNTITANAFRGDVTFTDVITGNVTVFGDIGGTLTLAKSNANTFVAGSIGGIVASENLAGTVRANEIGDVTVAGNLTGTVSTDADNDGAWDLGEFGIGNVDVTGNFTGSVYGVLGIGDVSVGGNLTSTGTALMTSSGTNAFAQANDAFFANIGTVTVAGDVSQGAGALINIAGNGTFGDVTVEGAGNTTANHTVGTITVAGQLGAPGTATGNISITDTTNATTTLTLGAINIGQGTAANGALGSVSITNSVGNVATSAINFAGTGSVGNITVVGGGAEGSTATVGAINLSTGTGGVSLGNVSVSGAEGLTINAISAKSVGDINATAVNVAGGVAPAVTLNGITANAGTATGNTASIGAITLNATSGGAVSIAGNIVTQNTGSGGASSIGAISLTGSTIGINANIQSVKIGAVTHTGNTTFGDGFGYKALGGLTSFTAVGNTTFNTTTSATASNLQFGGTTGPDLTFTGTTTFTGGAAPAILASNGGSGLDAIGNITFNGKVVGVSGQIDIRGSQIGNITATAALATNETLVTDLSVYAGNNAGTSAATAEVVARDGSNLASYSIGNITVQSTNTIGISGTALFAGDSTFNAIGKLGNINLQAGGSPAVQSALFATPGELLVFQTGNGNVIGNASPIPNSGIDFDGDGTVNSVTIGTTVTAANELNSQFATNVGVSIGTVTINARPDAGTFDSIDDVGGGSTSTGLFVLSGVKSATGTDLDAANLAVINTTAGEAIRGTVGNITVTNLNQQLSVSALVADLTGVTTPENAAVIAAAGVNATTAGSTGSPFGTINGVASALNALDNLKIVGGNNTTTDVNEIIVIRL